MKFPFMTFHMIRLLTFILLVTIFTGCSTVSSRIQENQGAYSQMSAQHKQLVSRGKIDIGMTSEAVYMALGKPGKVTTRLESGNRSEIWTYHRLMTDTIPQWSYYRRNRENGGYDVVPYYDPVYVNRLVPDLRVIFNKGKVAVIEEL